MKKTVFCLVFATGAMLVAQIGLAAGVDDFMPAGLIIVVR